MECTITKLDDLFYMLCYVLQESIIEFEPDNELEYDMTQSMNVIQCITKITKC